MFYVTVDKVPGYRIVQVLGTVSGSSIRAKHIGRDLMAGLKSIVGGELKGYTELLAESRSEAVKRMLKEAEKLGADGVVAVRFGTSSIMQGAAEMLAYGTAVKLAPETGAQAVPQQSYAPQQPQQQPYAPQNPPPPQGGGWPQGGGYPQGR